MKPRTLRSQNKTMEFKMHSLGMAGKHGWWYYIALDGSISSWNIQI